MSARSNCYCKRSPSRYRMTGASMLVAVVFSVYFLMAVCTDDVSEFVAIATEATKGSFIDKIHFTHAYSLMYGMFLLPMVKEFHAEGKPFKMMEIGLGCWENFAAVPADKTKKSAHIWDALLNDKDTLYVAEYDEPCALDWQRRGILPARVKLLLGDQSDAPTVRQWATSSGGHFDVIIDDGGHTNRQILTSFTELWPHVNAGGYYFIEDLQVSRRKDKEDTEGKYIMNDILKDWIEQLLIPR